MLQAHSLLWHYLWLAPNLLLLFLAALAYKHKLHKRFPVFVAAAVFMAITQLTVYAADMSKFVSGEMFWDVFWGSLLVEVLLKFAVIGEVFARIFGRYESVASLGKGLILGLGVVLIILAIVVAAYAPIDNPRYSIISRAHILDQTIYLVECGLLLFIFAFAAHFKLVWNRIGLGIALGLGLSACVHLATWAIMANGGMMDSRPLLDFINMAAFHVCVLIWFYYLLVPEKKRVTTSAAPLPENTLAIWNRELERLLQP